MKGLTDRQLAVLQFIQSHQASQGYPPTIREIGEQLGIKSTNGVNDHLKALERKGMLSRVGSKSRAMEVLSDAPAREAASATFETSVISSPMLEQEDDSLSIPMLGRIAAGTPIESIEDSSDRIRVDRSTLGRHARGKVFALRVKGESMIGDGILDGDTVFVAHGTEARDGEIAAVMVDGAATVKRIYRDGKTLRLEPSNPTMTAIIVRPEDGRDTYLLGKVVAVQRTLH
jgi:repressor LexA